MWCLLVLSNQSLNSLAVEEGEDLDITLCVVIRYVEPELVELIWRGVLCIEPYVTALGLTELCTISLGNEWQVIANASASEPSLRRISSVPVVMLPHWSAPPS